LQCVGALARRGSPEHAPHDAALGHHRSSEVDAGRVGAGPAVTDDDDDSALGHGLEVLTRYHRNSGEFVHNTKRREVTGAVVVVECCEKKACAALGQECS